MKNTTQEVSPASENLDPETTSFEVAVPSGRSIAGNTLWNLLGNCFPVAVAVVCLPILKRGLGTERLGIMSLAWVVIGYFSLFDLGLSRALTKLVAERIGQRRESEIPSLVWTSLFLMTGVATVGAILTFLLAPYLVERLLKVPASLSHEALGLFLLVGRWGACRGVDRGTARCARSPATVSAGYGHSYSDGNFYLSGACSTSGIYPQPRSHYCAACAGKDSCLRCSFMGLLSRDARLARRASDFHAASVKPLFIFGGWMTVSNVLGPLMVTFDRFLIGSIISIAAVAYYSIPYEVVTKLWLISSALIGVLFPAFSATSHHDRTRSGLPI